VHIAGWWGINEKEKKKGPKAYIKEGLLEDLVICEKVACQEAVLPRCFRFNNLSSTQIAVIRGGR